MVNTFLLAFSSKRLSMICSWSGLFAVRQIICIKNGGDPYSARASDCSFYTLHNEVNIDINSDIRVFRVRSACVSNVSPTSKISELFCESPSQIAYF